MIQKLRRRFIRITLIASSVVIFSLIVLINLADLLLIDRELTHILFNLAGGKEHNAREWSQEKEISGEEALWDSEKGKPALQPKGEKRGRLQRESRSFTLLYDERGLLAADLQRAFDVTEEQAGQFYQEIARRPEGMGYLRGYKYWIRGEGDGLRQAIFLDGRLHIALARDFFAISLLAAVLCIGLIYLLVRWMSRRAIDPLVKSAQQQKQFITNAGHELKTPLTVMKTCLSVLEMENGKSPWIDKAQAQADQMADLTRDLIALARADEQEDLVMRRISLSEVIERTTAPFFDFAEAQNRCLTADIAPDLYVEGDPKALEKLVRILLENALQHSPDGSAITVSFGLAGRTKQLVVANPCAALSREQLDHLFDRFYRADPSRESNGNFGIGLSIARAIAEAHGGELSARYDPDGGRLSIRFAVR